MDEPTIMNEWSYWFKYQYHF